MAFFRGRRLVDGLFFSDDEGVFTVLLVSVNE